jgi:integrase
MATIYKTDKGWRVQVCVKGKRVSKVLPTKGQARAWASEKEIELAGGKTIDASNRTVGHLFDRYFAEVSPHKKGYKWESYVFAALGKTALAKVFLDDLDSTHVVVWRDQCLKTVSPASVNRYLNLLSAVFTQAVKEWKWLQVNPTTDVRRLKASKPRDRRISEIEITQILAALGYEGSVVSKRTLLAAMFLFAIETGMRLGEICALKDGDYFDDYVVIRDSKNGDKRYIPLSLRARELAGQLKGRSTTPERATDMFLRAVRRAKIEDLTFHDSRHEACTRLARKLDVLDLARMIGHRDLKSLMIYYNATPSELAGRLG